jgi:hypothetical protein
MLKLYSENDTLKDSLAEMAEALTYAYGIVDSNCDGTEEHQYARSEMSDILSRAEINQYVAKRGTDRSNFIAKLDEALDLIKYPEVRNRENRIKWLQEYLNGLKASRTMEVKDVLIEVKK